ncbi:gamma-glutamyltransferase family protein [Salinicola avicenniae]|uniref:gamma-glutamyltransferase family protein n=1 Tax=Salinicola avicenniae TaxID=2916836 RepID=UPI00207386DF|nr:MULTISPECIES: gamma-glutamyltransferase family protein [unclassified Salinicola]
MQELSSCRCGMVVAPHHDASRAGLEVLREGGNAIEAMVAAAASIAVVYPHMNSLGGDGFWLVAEPGKPPLGIEGCGPAAALADRDFYRDYASIPSRGPLAALTPAGTVAGWELALQQSRRWGGRLPLTRLLAPAIDQARDGIRVTRGQAALTAAKLEELRGMPGFADHLLVDGEAPSEGATFRQPALATTLERLASAGLEDFYRGELGASMGDALEALGSPLRRSDLAAFHARQVTPLSLPLANGRVWNLPPPTQGVASLMILGIFERLCQRVGRPEAEAFDYVHGLVESTKRAFVERDRYVTDPRWMTLEPGALLLDERLNRLAAGIDRQRAMPWPQSGEPGDTVWMGCIDGAGRAVSFIQSTYWEFGSGVVLPSTGVVWQNRGISFALDPDARQALSPGRRPFHTLNPALARLDDGRTSVYGTMGGEGQPQTQAAIFTRHALYDQPWQAAIEAPRWLLGRTWGEGTTSLKLEARWPPALVEKLRQAGHRVDLVDSYSDSMGHAGGISRWPDGRLEGGADPRSDGSVAGF